MSKEIWAENEYTLDVAKHLPEVLYVNGDLPAQDRPVVAITGARMCSEYGRYVARIFGSALGAEGIQVITGMSLGIEGIAAKAALQAGGQVYSVLGCGVDICYPPENVDLWSNSAGVISEWEDGTQVKSVHFPQRHKIIAALADAVLVVEARRQTGCLNLAKYAVEMGKPVFAVPGRVTDRLSDGANALIKEGASMAFAPADVIDFCMASVYTAQERR